MLGDKSNNHAVDRRVLKELMEKLRCGSDSSEKTQAKDNYSCNAISIPGNFATTFPEFAMLTIKLRLTALEERMSKTRQEIVISRSSEKELSAQMRAKVQQLLPTLRDKMPKLAKALDSHIKDQMTIRQSEDLDHAQVSKSSEEQAITRSVVIDDSESLRRMSRAALNSARSSLDNPASEADVENVPDDLKILSRLADQTRVSGDRPATPVTISLEDLAIVQIQLCQKYQNDAKKNLTPEQTRKLFLDVERLAHEVEHYGTDNLGIDLNKIAIQKRIEPFEIALEYLRATAIFAFERKLSEGIPSYDISFLGNESQKLALCAKLTIVGLTIEPKKLTEYIATEDRQERLIDLLLKVASALQHFDEKASETQGYYNSYSNRNDPLTDVLAAVIDVKEKMDDCISIAAYNQLIQKILLHNYNNIIDGELKFNISS